MSHYVLARVTTLTGIDIALFDFDRHNALYYFILNAEEHIYLRYGGRDAASAMTYLNLDSLELALRQGLEQHALYEAGQLPQPAKPEPLYPKDIRSLNEAVIKRGHCVECHLVGDYRVTEREAAGTLNKLTDMFVYPDIRTLGIALDVPKGLRVAEANRHAGEAGMKAGDVITAFNGHAVITFGDLQYRLQQVPRTASSVGLTISRDGETHSIEITLPSQWWVTDLTHRYWTVDPLVFFKAVPLTAEAKTELKLPANGFASEVTEVDIDALLEGAHDLEEGDWIVSVNGEQEDSLTQDVITHIKLRHRAGDELKLGVIRAQQEIILPLKTKRQRFRKRE